tara:strand:+ start:1101 stop:1436 length:336 start_codon:yes stop_codon:yes gene_type:complete
MNLLNEGKIDNISELNKFLLINDIVLVNCGLTYCEPCKKVYPDFVKLSDTYKNIKFIKIEFDMLSDEEHNSLKEKFKIGKYPHFALICNGEILDTKQTSNIDEIESLIKYL